MNEKANREQEDSKANKRKEGDGERIPHLNERFCISEPQILWPQLRLPNGRKMPRPFTINRHDKAGFLFA
jgi:hypothetical protein